MSFISNQLLKNSKFHRCFSTSTIRGRKPQLSLEHSRKLYDLELDVRKNPTNEALLLKEYNRIDPLMTIQRFEDGRYYRDDGVLREYIKALVLTNRFDSSDALGVVREKSTKQLDALLRQLHDFNGTTSSTPSGNITLNNETPLKVTVQEESANSHTFWKFAKYAITLLFGLSAASLFTENISNNIQKGQGSISKKEIVPVTNITTKFDDVKGCESVKEEVQEIVEYLKDPKKFSRLGAKMPKGILLAGDPGTGKTLIARAIAGEAGVNFFQTSGSEFEEMYVGVGARRIRELFQAARKASPCIVFIDEIDAVGSKRSSRDNSAVRMTLNQLLVELDGFEQNEGIIIICATNFPQSLDKALIRPGRFDKIINVPLPDYNGRIDILKLYSNKIILNANVNLDSLAKRTAGMSGADLFNLLNIAAIQSSKDNKDNITNDYIEDAFDRILMGIERKSPLSYEEKKMTAYHEGGHSLITIHLKGLDPVHKATIIPRGMAMGVTQTAPTSDKYSEKLHELKAYLVMCMAGKAAEEIIFGSDNVTTGCVNDLQQATNVARRMVMQYGMASLDDFKLNINKNIEHGNDVHLPMFIDPNDYGTLSESLRNQVDKAVHQLLSDAYQQAIHILTTNKSQLDGIAECLLEFETLDSMELKFSLTNSKDKIVEYRKNNQIKATKNSKSEINKTVEKSEKNEKNEKNNLTA